MGSSAQGATASRWGVSWLVLRCTHSPFVRRTAWRLVSRCSVWASSASSSRALRSAVRSGDVPPVSGAVVHDHTSAAGYVAVRLGVALAVAWIAGTVNTPTPAGLAVAFGLACGLVYAFVRRVQRGLGALRAADNDDGLLLGELGARGVAGPAGGLRRWPGRHDPATSCPARGDAAEAVTE